MKIRRNIRRNDTVSVTAGKEKGKQGKVQRVLVKEHRVVVEGLNFVIRHERPNQQGARQAGRVQKESPMDISNVMLVCPNCNSNTRVEVKFLDDGKKLRVCIKCKGTIE